MTEQEDVWQEHTKNMTLDDIENSLNNPAVFQVELSSLISSIAEKEEYKRIIEVGCEQGIVTMLTSARLERHLLDLNQDIIKKLERFNELNKLSLTLHHEDMFAMNIDDGKFDLLHNSGVIEHFDCSDRVRLLKEYARILSDNGTMVISIPNHYSVSYRLAYLFHNHILRGWKWPWPREYKIYDMKSEIEAAGLTLIERKVLAYDTAFKFWRPFSFVGSIFKLFGLCFKIEGYLTTLIIRK